jgi:HEXXH motif-containing protein
MAMDDLAERIKASIENPDGELWFPDLTADLAARAWDSLHGDLGLTPDSYGTERVLSRSISAPREVLTSLKTCPSTCATASDISIEALPQERAVQYQKQGVTFYTPAEILHTTILSCIEDAIAIINQVPSLMKTVAALVRSLHVIKPEDEDHDVSFSEPYIPFSIFVSVPERRIENDALRVAEAIIHEAMHLQLTTIDCILPLASSTKGRYFSPWRRQHRSSEGLIHALYVFRVIETFMKELPPLDPNYSGGHISGRRWQITQEIRQTLSFQSCLELTPLGSSFIRGLLDLCES